MQGKVKLEDIFNELGWDCDSAIADDFHRIFKNLVDEEDYLDFDKAEIQLALRDFIEANESDYQGDIIHSILDKFLNDEFIAGEGIDESYEILAEDPMDDENISFEEIINRMSNAVDYCELYDAADLIVNPSLRNQVINLISENEEDDEDVDVVYSIVTTDLLDSRINDKNLIDLEESKIVEGLYDDCYKISDKEELKEIALNAIYVANNDNEIISELLDRVSEDDLLDYNVDTEDLKSGLYDFVANNYTNISIELLREIALNAVYVADNDEAIRKEIRDRNNLNESESSVIDSLMKSDEEILKDAIEDLKDDEDEAIEGYEDFKVTAAEHVSEDTVQDLNNIINEIEDEEKEHLEKLDAIESGMELDENKTLEESSLGNNTFTDRDEAEYYRNKELYDYSHLARHKEAMDKAKEACDKKGIQVNTDRGIYESKDNIETKTPREEIEDMIQRTHDREYKIGIEESKITEANDITIGRVINIPYTNGTYTPNEVSTAKIIGVTDDGKYITLETTTKMEITRNQYNEFMREYNNTESTEAKEYRYITNHGIGPGTMPNGVFVRSEELDHGKTAIYTNRPLTSEELEKYDIKPEWIQESKEVKTESNVIWSSEYNYDEDTINQAYDEYMTDFEPTPVAPMSFENWLEDTEEFWFESIFEQYKEEHPDWRNENEDDLDYKLNDMVYREIQANMDDLKDQYNEYCEEVKNSGEMTNPLDRERWEFSYTEQDAEDQWEVMSENFSEVVFPMIEKQCNHDKLILLGSVGRWNGTYGGGKVIDAEEDELRKLMSDYDEISITEDDGNLSINFTHHDGTDSMNLYTFPQDLTELAKAMDYDNVDEFESDMINDYLSESDLAEHANLLIPIKHSVN